MIDTIPFVKQRYSALQDFSRVKTFAKAGLVRKLKSYYELGTFSIPNVWRGASEIVARFDFPTSLITITNQFPLIPPSDVNFCAVISWLKDEVYYRYKLWKDVGEILWLPDYEKQKVTSDSFFSIEIWNTDSRQPIMLGIDGMPGVGLGIDGLPDTGLLIGYGAELDLILSQAIRIYTSRLTIPVDRCNSDDINLGAPTECVDPVYHLEDFEPLYGDYYELITPCERLLIKGIVAKPEFNIIQNRDDLTWHEVWMYVNPDGQVALDINPDNAAEPVGALGYFPMVGAIGTIYKFELVNGPDGTGNYPTMDTLVTGVDAFNVVLIQDGANRDDNHLYGFMLIRVSSGIYTTQVIQDIIPL